MIALLQRVNWAQVKIDGQLHAEISRGLLVFIGLQKDDNEDKANKLLDKILSYRVFPDAEGKMNSSLIDIAADLLLVSQFTLAADTNKGLRPSFSSAMSPELAEPLYDYIIARAREKQQKIQTGKFGADMKIGLENDGPVTFRLKT